MRRIVDGLRYDTETAEHVASASYGYARDFASWNEDLYRTPRGAYFLHYEGGPSSRYAVPVPGGRGGSSGIRPLTSAEALAWLEEHGETEAIEAHFGEEVQDA